MNGGKQLILVAAASLAITACKDKEPRPAPTKLSCVNPAMDVTLHKVPNTQGKASTYSVQINVNRPATAGTLFVDANNAARCNIDNAASVTGGRARIMRSESDVPDAVAAEFVHVEKAAPHFIVRLQPPQNDSQGTVNVRFEVDYR